MSQETDREAMGVTVGRALRDARLRRGLTTRQLAELAGVSQSFLSGVENGRAMPSVPSLYAIAGSLDLTAAELLPQGFEPLAVTRDGVGVPVPMGDENEPAHPGQSMRRLSGASSRRLDVYEFIAPADGHRSATLAHPGEDLLFVIAGDVVVDVEGEEHALGAGDALWWDARRPHAFIVPASTRGDAKALIVSAPGTQPSDGPRADASSREGADALAVGVGRAIGAERRSQRLSMRELAARVGVSQPFLSSVENGRSFPGVLLLYAIARVLDVPPSHLMPSGSRESRVTHGGSGSASGDDRPRDLVETPLSFDRSRGIEAHHVALRGGYRQESALVHAGEDFVYVLAGEALLHVGDESVRLRRGDSAGFDARLPHRLSAASSTAIPAEVLFITAHT